MSFPKYYVTYCVMDMDAGANPFGHSFLMFSKQNSLNGPIEVLDGIGHYSQPSTTSNLIIKNLKKLLGFQIDLQDGHGVLVQEPMRTINGNGLKGISFEVAEDRFKLLQESYQASMRAEQEAIKELNDELEKNGQEPNGYNRYKAELEKAKAGTREPRLKPFHVTMQLTINGFDSTRSYTCKDRSLELLSQNEIVSPQVEQQIICSRAKQAFPRFSTLNLPPIRLISTGEPEKHTSKKGKTFYNHVWGRNSLYWATPVITIETSLTSLQSSTLKENYQLIKNIMARIGKIEELLRQKIRELSGRKENKEFVNALSIQLKRTENLSLLFSNASENQIPEALNEKLLTADKVLNIAMLAMDPQRLNYTFVLRAYNSLAAQNALVGLLAILISTALIFVAPPVGIALTVLTTLSSARHAYGFYKEEVEFAQVSKDYRGIVNQTELEPLEASESSGLRSYA